jgi:hypothetical protein
MYHAFRHSREGGSRHSEAGDTLVEVLIAVAVLALCVSALLGALVTTITSASEHRSLASIDTALRSYAEQLKYDVELNPNTSGTLPNAPWYMQCATVTTSSYAGQQVLPPANLPAGYTVVIQGIEYWNGINAFDSISSTLCASEPANQLDDRTSGLQLLTLEATAPNGVTETLSVGVRQP